MGKIFDSLREVLVPVVAVACLFVLWEGLVYLSGIPSYILPAPSLIWVQTNELGPVVLVHLAATLKTVFLGFALSAVVSLPIAIAITSSSTISNAIYPALVLTQSIPKVALAPILIVALGANELPRVLVTFLVAFFPLVVSTATGLQSTPPDLLELGRSLRASRWKEIWRIRLPFAVPFIFGGLKVAVTLCVVGAVVGEFVAADAGLGYMITTSMAFFKVAAAWGAMIILSFLGILLFQAVALVERVFFPWSIPDDRLGA